MSNGARGGECAWAVSGGIAGGSMEITTGIAGDLIAMGAGYGCGCVAETGVLAGACEMAGFGSVCEAYAASASCAQGPLGRVSHGLVGGGEGNATVGGWKMRKCGWGAGCVGGGHWEGGGGLGGRSWPAGSA